MSCAVIAIDGPAGAGKSTIAGLVAERLGCRRLDTGAMYRSVTLLALRSGIDLDDAEALGRVARAMNLVSGEIVLLEGEDVTEAIRSPEVDAAVSRVAAHPTVRVEMVDRQRKWVAENGGGVVEGRDIGSVVLPGADLKVFLTADVAERARRRSDPTITTRDALDSSRSVSPLVVPEGAVVIDSTDRTPEEVAAEVLSHL